VPTRETQLHAVPAPDPIDDPRLGSLEDLGLMAMLFAIAIIPLASSLAGLGRWSDVEVGLGGVGALFTGRELVACLVAWFRSWRRP
jgi:hypothetical protein